MSTPATLRTIAHLPDGSDVGAWMLTADLAEWDLDELVGLGEYVESWSFDDDNERVALMKAGDPCVLWVYGNLHGEKVAGLWAIGEVGSAPYEAVEADPTDDVAAAAAVDDDEWDDSEVYIDIDLQFLSEPIPRATLQADKRFGKAIILHQPDMSDPIPLTPAEYAFIELFLDDNGLWPDDPESDAVLDDAEDAAIEHLESLGLVVEQRDEPPYLVARTPAGEREVLIAPTTSPDEFVLGAAEFDDLRAEPDPVLLVVVVFGDAPLDVDELGNIEAAAAGGNGVSVDGEGVAEGDRGPYVAHVIDDWRPDPERYDRSTQLHHV